MSYWLKAIEEGHERWKKDLEKLWAQQGKALNKSVDLNLLEELDKVWRNPFNTQNLNTTHMDEQLNQAPGPVENNDLGPVVSGEVLDNGNVPTSIPEVADVLEEGIQAPDNASVIKHLCDELYEQILDIRGPGAWEAEFQHAAAVAQTF